MTNDVSSHNVPSSLSNERAGDRINVTYDEARDAALKYYGDAANAQYEAAIRVAVVYTTGLGGGMEGVTEARKHLRADYIAKRCEGAEGVEKDARANAARVAWNRFEARVNVALLAMDRAARPTAAKHSAWSILRTIYNLSTASEMIFGDMVELIRAGFKGAGIVNGETFADLAKPKAEKKIVAFDAMKLAEKVSKMLDGASEKEIENFRAALDKLLKAPDASFGAINPAFLKRFDAAIAAQAADDEGAAEAVA